MNYITKNENVYLKKEDGSEEFIFKDIKIVRRIRNVNTKKIMCIISFKYAEQVIEECVPRSTILTKKNILGLQDIGVGVTEANAHYMIDYIKQQEEKIEIEVSHSQLGYDSESNKFRLYNSFPNESIYDGNIDIKPKGTYEGWLNIYDKQVKGNSRLELAITIAASSAVIGIIGKEIGIENPIVHIYGDSSTGKTTAVQLGLSIWGSPSLRSNGLVQNYNETINALMHNLKYNHGVAMCFDEISMSESEDFTGFIYSSTNGKEKGRLTYEQGKGYTKQEQATWNTVILSTGEYNILEKAKENDGLKVRVFSIGGFQWTSSSSNSDSIKNGILDNYGYVGEKFISELMKYDKSELYDLYKSLYEKLVKRFEEEKIWDELTNRRVKYYTILLISANLLNRYLKLGIALKSILSNIFEIESSSIVERNVGEQAYKSFLELVAKNRKKFPVIKGKGYSRENIRDDIWGYVLKQDCEVEIFPHEFKKQIKQLGFQSSRVILNKWKKMKKLNHESDRLDRSRGGNQVYVINVDNEFIESIWQDNIALGDSIQII